MKAAFCVVNPPLEIFSDREVIKACACLHWARAATIGPGTVVFFILHKAPVKDNEPAGNATDRNPVELGGAYSVRKRSEVIRAIPGYSRAILRVSIMKTIIYYFTGTGNSLATAKKIAAVLGDCELVSIASLQKTKGTIVPQAERVGIICPVYFTGLPVMVAECAGRLDLSHTRYAFSVVTFGGSGASSALWQIDSILTKQQHRGLDAGFMVKMPGNYILMYGSPAGKKRENLLARADVQIADIAGAVGRSEKRKLPFSVLVRLVHSLAYPRFSSHVHEDDRKFTVSENCTSCGTCAAICPADNIELVEGKPVWKHHCELCCGCIHLCPVGAIQAGSRTATRQRYRNPSVSIPELKQLREPGQ